MMISQFGLEKQAKHICILIRQNHYVLAISYLVIAYSDIPQIPDTLIPYTYIIAIYESIWQHHGRVVLIQGLTRDVTDESRLCAVGEWKSSGKFI